MKHLGIEVSVKHVPELDPGFLPLGKFNAAFLKDAKQPLDVAVERAGGEVAVYKTFIHGTPEMAEADIYYVDRLIKMLLWMKGGFKVYLSGSKAVYEAMKATYCVGGKRAFDADFMSNVYEKPFEVVYCDQVPAEKSNPQAVGRHLGGCRIGFDAGGSDRKVSAVIDGEPVFSEEVVWFPKTTADPDYHYEGIVSALKSAAAHMPRVDAVGVSSAGIYIENRTMVASLFLKVPKDLFDAKVKDIYIRAIKDTFGDVPYVVANDGDVSALAGAMSLEENNILGIAMGTSEAVGYVDQNGNITGWLNELAFAPVDVSPSAMEDEWSGDIGCGVKYFSQDSVIKLAPPAGINLSADLSPAEKLKEVQKLMEVPGSPAEAIYRSIGVYLGHSLALYHHFYGFKHVLLLGRVMSGRGGDIILDVCKQVLADEYPEVAGKINPTLPDEESPGPPSKGGPAMAIFNPENSIWRVTGKLVDLMILSVFWLACSLPVVTLGPASAALYHTVVQCIRGNRRDSWTLFFRTFRDNLKVGVLTTLVVLAVGAALLFLHGLAYQMAAAGTAESVFYLCYTFLLLLPLGVACYLFPVLSRFTFGAGGLLSNVHLPSTLAMALELYLALELLLRIPLIALVLFPGLTALFQSFFLERIFAPYIRAQLGAEDEDEGDS